MKKYRFFITTILLTFGVQALLYFMSKFLISNYHLIGSPLDDKIPVVSFFIFAYMIWYPLEITTFYFLYKHDKKGYIKLVIALAMSLITAQICYYVYPTMINRPIMDSYHNLTTFVTYLTYASDTPVNCFPSVHCIICFLVIFATIHNPNLGKAYKYLIYLLNILIILSTLFVKQHVIIDVIGALIISALCYYLLTNLKFFKNIQNKLSKYA